MAWFKKKGVLDLNEAKKRNLLIMKKRALENSVDKNGYRDFSVKMKKETFSEAVTDPFSNIQKSSSASVAENSGFGFLGNLASASQSSDSYSNNYENDSSILNSSPDTSNADEKRKRLAKRIRMMSEKIEENSNEIFKLQQKIAELERKLGEKY